MCRSRPFRAGRSAPVVCVLTVAHASATLVRSAPPPIVVSWRGPRGAVRSDSPRKAYNLNRLAPRDVVRFNFYVSPRNHLYKFGVVGPRLRLTTANLAPPPIRGGALGGGRDWTRNAICLQPNGRLHTNYVFRKAVFSNYIQIILQQLQALFQLGIKKIKKCLDAVCIIVYICVCERWECSRAQKKGRSKMITINLSENDFNKIADILDQRILYYHSLAKNAHIVDDENQFLKQMKKVAFYTRLKTVFLGEKI